MNSLVTTRHPVRTCRNSRIGAMLDGLDACRRMVGVESRGRMLPAQFAGENGLAIVTFTNAFNYHEQGWTRADRGY